MARMDRQRARDEVVRLATRRLALVDVYRRAAERLAGQGRFVGMLAEHGHLRPDVSVEHARDVVWTLCSLAVHDLLVVARGWTEGRYQDWLATAMARELLASTQGG